MDDGMYRTAGSAGGRGGRRRRSLPLAGWRAPNRRDGARRSGSTEQPANRPAAANVPPPAPGASPMTQAGDSPPGRRFTRSGGARCTARAERETRREPTAPTSPKPSAAVVIAPRGGRGRGAARRRSDSGASRGTGGRSHRPRPGPPAPTVRSRSPWCRRRLPRRRPRPWRDVRHRVGRRASRRLPTRRRRSAAPPARPHRPTSWCWPSSAGSLRRLPRRTALGINNFRLRRWAAVPGRCSPIGRRR